MNNWLNLSRVTITNRHSLILYFKIRSNIYINIICGFLCQKCSSKLCQQSLFGMKKLQSS